MYRNEAGHTAQVYYFQTFLLLTLCSLSHCTDTVTVNNNSATLNHTELKSSNNTSGAVDYRTWQEEHINSKLYLGHGIFLYKDNNTNSTQDDWLIKTDDIPKLFHFGFPASNTDNSNSQSGGDSETSGRATVRPWVLGLACFVGGLLIMVAVTVAILARRWMQKPLRRRRRLHRHRIRDEVVVEADPEAPKITGPSTICQRLPRPLPRLGIPPDDGLPPYTRLEPPTGYSSMLDLTSDEQNHHHPLDLPLPSYSEISPVHTARRAGDPRRFNRQLDHLTEYTCSDARNNENHCTERNGTYSHSAGENSLRITTNFSREDTGIVYPQSSSSENRFIPSHLSEDEELTILDGGNVQGGHCLPSRHRQQLQHLQNKHTDNLTVADSSINNLSNRQRHHLSTSCSGNNSSSIPPHTTAPVFISEGDRFHKENVPSTHDVNPTERRISLPHQAQHRRGEGGDRGMLLSPVFTEQSCNRNISDIPIQAVVLPRFYHTTSTTSCGTEGLRDNDVREDILGARTSDHLSSSPGCMTHCSLMDSDLLNETTEGLFIAE